MSLSLLKKNMISRDEILEIDAYCRDNGVTRAAYLRDIGVTQNIYYSSRRRWFGCDVVAQRGTPIESVDADLGHAKGGWARGYPGFVLGVGIPSGLKNGGRLSFQINFWLGIFCMIIIIGGSLLAGIIPANRAITIKAIDALRDE